MDNVDEGLLKKYVIKKLQSTIKSVVELGYIDVDDSGCYIFSRSFIKKQQELWPDNEEFKQFNFTRYKYWIISYSDALPFGFDKKDDVINDLLIFIKHQAEQFENQKISTNGQDSERNL